MSTDSEIILASSESVEDTGRNERALPFSFAKRHGVLIREIGKVEADTVYRPGVSPQSLAEARRFAGVPLKLSRVTVEVFESLLQES